MKFCSAAVIAISVFSTNLAIASGGPGISFTGGIDGRPVSVVGETFYHASFSVTYSDGAVILSANHDGTGDVSVDDALVIRVTGPDSKVRIYKHDYSNNCQGVISPTAPVDISNTFRTGVNKVQIVMRDRCGSSEGASSFWLLP